MRFIHLLVIGALIFAAAHVYRIKMDSTARTEKELRMHAEIREQRDAIAALRSEWAKFGGPLGPRRCAPKGPSAVRPCRCRACPAGICSSSRSPARNMIH